MIFIVNMIDSSQTVPFYAELFLKYRANSLLASTYDSELV
jgi:hypothetical protein